MKINKKFMAMFIGSTMVMTTTAFAAETTDAKLSTDFMSVNGKSISIYGYQINNNNYYKLRDIACALQGTNADFSVYFVDNKIQVDTNGNYMEIGGELTYNGKSTTKARKNNSPIYVDNNAVNVNYYEIDGYNYFKLRDICDFVGADVSYDSASSTVMVNSGSVQSTSTTPITPITSTVSSTSEVLMPASGSWITPEANEMLEYINDHRVNAFHTHRLELNEDLCHGAMIRAKEATIELAHTRPNGAMYANVMNEISPTGYSAIQASAENLVFTVNTAKEAYDAWYKSPGHYTTMFRKCYTKLGVGFSNGTWVLLLS